jgi:DUF4097 and DUF4098 domain-containing protein YvlB
MRRKSLFGPIVILLFGTLFLVRNFRPDIPVWHLFSQYWPLLLIALGVLKLVQALGPHDPSLPPRPIVTGGEVFLIVLLCLIGAAIFHAPHVNVDMNIPWNEVFGRDFTYTHETTQEVSEGQPSIVVVNPFGEVHVEGTDAKQVEVKTEKRVSAVDDDSAKQADDASPVVITREGADYVVRVNYPTAGRHVSLHANLDIEVPRGSAVRIDGKHGDVRVRSVAGPVNLTVDRGDVDVEDVAGKLKLDLRHGSVTAQRVKGGVEMDGSANDIQIGDIDNAVVVRGEYTGTIAFANVKSLKWSSSRTEMEIAKLPGKLDMSVGSLTITEPSGDVTIRTSSKDIRIEDFDGSVQVNDRDAGVELSTKKNPVGAIEVENKSGKIEVTLPSSGHFQVDATARRGEVESEFSGISVKRENENGTMTGSVGTNGSTVKLNTTYGSIHLRKEG